MRSVLIIVLTTAFYASVQCGYISEIGHDLLISQIAQLKQNQDVIQQRLDFAELHISTLQVQLESQKTKFKKLQREMSVFTDADVSDEEVYQNSNERKNTPREEIEPLEPIQKTHHKPLTKEAVTCQPQLENEEVNKTLSESTAPPSGDYKWVPWKSHMEIPDNAVFAGDRTFPMYVARVSHNGDTIVGKLYWPLRLCYIPSGGKEVHYRQCEVLTGSGFSWVPYSGTDDALPENAFSEGRNPLNGDRLYIGRVHHWAEDLKRVEPAPGTFEGRCKILSISYGGKEHKYNEFDVLVVETNGNVEATTNTIDVTSSQAEGENEIAA